MPPQLSSSGRASLAIASIWMLAAAILLGAGYPAAAWPVLFASSSLFALLMVAFYLSIPVGRLVEPPHFEAKLELPEQSLIHAGEPIRISVELRNRGPFALRAMRLRAELSSSLSTPASLCLDVPASSSVSTEFELEAVRSGRYFVHGFHLEAWGPLRLFRIRSYLASACARVVLPRRTPLAIDASRAAPRRSERLGAHELSQRGFGMQLREIRDHQPGDPYRNIAWKASARLGRLMVREFENEVAVSAYLMLDISTSMRGASDRPDKLEHAIELCMAMARSLSKGSDRFGLISFDERVYGHVAAAEGGRQSHRVGQHLLGLHQLVDEESSDFDDDEVVEHLVRYLMLQHRLDFRHMNPRRRSADHEEGIEDRINVVLLNRWLNQQLKQSPKELLASLQVGVVRPEQSFARRYCQLHGIELPYRSEARYGGKDNGLLAALECALTNARQPSLFLIVSDLNGLLDYARCARAMQLAKSKHHRVLILAPYTPSYFEEASTEQASKSVELQTQRVLHGLFSEVERREREKALRVLSKAGIPVLDMRRSDGVEALLQRISTGRA